ncbi:MAG: hypothetical protein HQL56_05130 [Magnetococcales bacterium]|nr:hypothetical protein [Magnetococcales bacterium]
MNGKKAWKASFESGEASMDLIFNELSLAPCAPSREIARERVKTFLETLRTAFSQGISRQLRTQEAFKDSLLAEGYSWWAWMTDSVVDKEERQYLKALATRTPFLDGLQDAQDQSMSCEVFFDNKKAEGLGAAYFTEGLSVSLNSNSHWDMPFLVVTIHELNDGGELIESHHDLPHASHPDHIEKHHQSWIQETIKRSVTSWSDLWESRTGFFPSLIFCEGIREQMLDLPKNTLQSFVRGLFCLEKYCQSWGSGGFDLSALGCQSSSEGEVSKTRFKDERTFSCQDGQKITFIYHVKLANPWRIYFDPTPGPGRMFVGYVGRHLRTKHDH